ncbi:MAG: hypothetical protein KatS3mg034_0864 [Vicingaceae bacterium]|jgi:hypothetical protein|nr:MAG: hypothetical protein KatS3mg034_0864 [Vicingaceae bacterium]
MFGKLVQIIFVFTSLSPVLLTFWFKEFKKNYNWCDGLIFLILALLLLLILYFIIKIANQKLEKIPIEIDEVSSADQESIIFIFTYLLPLLDVDNSMILFLFALFSIIVFTTNLYHFNPMLGILGYHQYEIKINGGTSFILITKKTLVNTKQIKHVVQLTNYIILEK